MKRILAGCLSIILTALLLAGCGSKNSGPGAAFLKQFNVPDIRVKSVDLDAIGQRNYTKNYNNPAGDVAPTGWKNNFMRAIAQYTKVTISDEAAEAYIETMAGWREALKDKQFGNMFYMYSDQAGMGCSNAEKGNVAYDYWLNASKIMIKRVLGVDAVAKAKNITVSDETFAAFCKDYGVNTADEKEAAFARYCCLEDLVVRAYLPDHEIPGYPGILPETFDSGFIDLSDY